MEKGSAKKLIRETFERSFERGRFIYFVKNLLNKIDESGSTVLKGSHLPDAYKPHIESLEYVGSYEDGEESGLDILIVQLKKETSLERARTMQRNFISWYLNGGRGGALRDASLVAFVSPSENEWRFSFVKMDYRFVEGKNGKTKVKEEFTPSRRYSFLVGKNEKSHTAQFQLLSLLENDEENPTLFEIEDLFNIEVVTKEFFKQYRELYLDIDEAMGKLVKKDSKIRKDFEGKNIDTVEFSKKLLGQIVFLYFLQKKGWFGVERNENWGTGPKNFLRQLFKKEIGSYSNFFNDILEPLFYEALALERTHDYYGKLDCKIPFLNGGLFDPLNNYDWVHTDILIPNDLFSNGTKTSKGDVGTGILDVFDRFNFTVREDEPLEKEVAVDPEMLGKVFENLLEVKDRKSKGAFYTPREIVHYMCQESLAHYLEAELNEKVSREDIEALIKFGETVVEHDSRVAKSGKETERYSFKLPEIIRQNSKNLDSALAKIRVCDPAVGSGAFLVGMMSEIVSTRNALTNYLDNDTDRSPYNFKRHAIQNSLYGVDIDIGATEICKLRLWLSLVVDEEDIEQIQPLPNLDYKIVVGNSLLKVEKDLYNDSLFKKLEEIKPKYFDETNAKRKKKYQDNINLLIGQITNGNNEFDFEVYFSEVYHAKQGFDILIANPPYGVKFSKEEKSYLKAEFSYSIAGKFESYRIFIEKGISLLRNEGILTYVTPNTWMFLEQAQNFRKYLLERSVFLTVISFPQKTFSATVDSLSMILKKASPKSSHLVQIIEIPLKETVGSIESYLSNVALVAQENWVKNKDNIISYGANEEDRILVEKVLLNNEKLSEHIITRQGLIPYLTKEDGNSNKYISNKKIDKFWKSYLDGSRFVGRYIIKESKSYIKYGDWLYARREKWVFNRPRIIVQLIRNISLKRRIIANYLDHELYSDRNTGLLFIKESSQLDLKYILGILNSNLLNYIHSKTHNSTYISFPSLEKLPIVVVPHEKQKYLIALVEQILNIKEKNKQAKKSKSSEQLDAIELKINKYIYKLYSLGDDDIKVVEKFNSSSL